MGGEIETRSEGRGVGLFASVPTFALLLLPFLLSFLLPSSSFAQTWAESQGNPSNRGEARNINSARANQLKLELGQKAQGLVNQVLALHCPDRCSLLGVEVEVEEGQSLLRVQPGFEELSGGPKTLKASRIELSLLMDARLPQAFRRDVLALTQARLKSLSVPVVVRSDAVPYPEPLPLEVLDIPEVQTPEPERRPDAAFEPSAVEAPLDLSEEAYRTLLKSAPWLLALLIAGIFTLLLSRNFRRASSSPHAGSLADLRRSDPLDAGAREGAASALALAPSLEALVSRLGASLRKSPQARQSVLKELLVSGKIEDFAQLVRLLGPSIADGLRDDLDVRAALRQAASLLKSGSLPEPGEASLRRLLLDLDSRLGGARLELGDQGEHSLFSFTQRLSLPSLLKLLKSSTPTSQVVLLQHLSAQQRDQVLQQLDEPSRQRLVLAVASSDSEVLQHPESLLQIADELRQQAEHFSAASSGEVELLLELLEAQDESEQLALLAGLSSRPHLQQALLGSLCNESTLSAVDDEVVAAVAARARVSTLVDFLRGAPLNLQERFVSLSPKSSAGALRDELSLRARSSKGATRSARKEVLGLAREEIESRGLSLLALNDELAAHLVAQVRLAESRREAEGA